MIRAALLLLALALPAAAQERIVLGLSQYSVTITTNYIGTEILVYGAVQRDAPPPEGPPLEVIVAVEGPHTPVMVRRKDRSFGIWVNADAVRVDSAPSFYAVATTGPLDEILSQTDDLRHRITIRQAIRSVGMSSETDDPQTFLDALVRIREAQGRFRINEGAVAFDEATLFRTDVALPADLTEGDYRVRIFLTRDGQVVDMLERQIGVRKAGLERFLYNLSREQSLVYGLLALAMAVLAGWGASGLFRLLRR
ncbi:TIGR02186 family protein [Falsirhodobacter halotolerans]|uniref:TIGR02186 family protein n=1 Tax=Falsirhodobacter halotolerans TaxID=1146892 RepID=UPI001FD31DEF|nr:TIGR02186 family protein [Falsirhodobacter halotolerans]MCJ8138668.1 TIGR02186 family protein [Falsirhodobacter halotolerans]